MLRLVICSLVASIACSPSESVESVPPYESGTRLRARVISAGDGADLFVVWRDSMLEIDCAFGVAADGAVRCLPLADRTVWLTATDIVYLDAACTVPARVMRAGLPAPPLLPVPAALTGDCTEARTSVVRRGAYLPSPGDTAYDVDDTGGCQVLAELDATIDVYGLGLEVPPEELVRASIVEEGRSERLSARVAVADDGARQTLGLVDRRAGAPCDVLDWLDPDACVPTRVAWSAGEYADPACTAPVAYSAWSAPLGGGPGLCTAEPQIAIDIRSCPPSFFEVGREVTEAYRLGATCAVSTSESHHNWVVGAPLPEGTLPAVHSSAVGSGALRLPTLAAENGALLVQEQRFENATTGETCAPVRASDSTLRCVPYHVTDDVLRFEDEACTTPVVPHYPGDCGGPPPPVVVTYDGLDRVASYRVVGDRTTPARLYDLSDSVCAPSVDVDPSEEHYRVGPLLPIDFPELLERIE